MSSHREAPAISKDPVADNTDTYAFVSPDDPGTVDDHLELPAARGAVRGSELLRVRRRRPLRDPHRQRRRRQAGDHVSSSSSTRRCATRTRSSTTPATIESIGSSELEPAPVLHGDAREERTASGARAAPRLPAVQHRSGRRRRTTRHWPGRRSTRSATATRCSPASDSRGSTSISGRSSTSVTCGRSRTCISRRWPAAPGVNATNDFGVHSIALKVPKHELTRSGSTPTNAASQGSVIGVWAAASRRRAVIREGRSGRSHQTGHWVQVSRLGNPLFNEVIVPMGEKDRWNSLPGRG